MVEVKEEYKKQYQTLLADDIKKNYEGNLEKILLGLIKGGPIPSMMRPFFHFLYRVRLNAGKIDMPQISSSQILSNF